MGKVYGTLPPRGQRWHICQMIALITYIKNVKGHIPLTCGTIEISASKERTRRPVYGKLAVCGFFWFSHMLYISKSRTKVSMAASLYLVIYARYSAPKFQYGDMSPSVDFSDFHMRLLRLLFYSLRCTTYVKIRKIHRGQHAAILELWHAIACVYYKIGTCRHWDFCSTHWDVQHMWKSEKSTVAVSSKHLFIFNILTSLSLYISLLPHVREMRPLTILKYY